MTRSDMSRLSKRHREALSWFTERAGTECGWPNALPDGTLLVARPKGIYKPRWTTYALSVRQTLQGPYADRDPIHHEDGTWSYVYCQERNQPAYFTNKALVACLEDSVPVGVLRQLRKNPTQYEVLGTARVLDYSSGFFYLRGPFEAALTAENVEGPFRKSLERIATEDAEESPGSGSSTDAREIVLRSIVARRGQQRFRESLLQAYGGRCAITACDFIPALEAAHIIPYSGVSSNRVSNGLLLRADVHSLWDLNLLSIDIGTNRVLLSPILAGSSYRYLHGTLARLPKGADRPSTEALATHRKWSKF